MVKIETWLRQTKGLLYSTNEMVKVAEKQATSTIAWVIEEYKKMDTFEWDIVKAEADAFLLVFADYKDKVAQV